MLALYEPRNSGAVGTIKSLVVGLVGFSVLAILVQLREGMWLAVAAPYFAFLIGLNTLDLTGLQDGALIPRCDTRKRSTLSPRPSLDSPLCISTITFRRGNLYLCLRRVLLLRL